MMVMVVMVVMMMAMVAIWFIVVMVIKLNIIMIFEKTDHQSRARPRHRPNCQRGGLNVYVYHDGCENVTTTILTMMIMVLMMMVMVMAVVLH